MYREITFHLDSRHRDASKYPSPNDYVVDLPETLRDVVSVELVYASYTKFCADDYFILSIDELEPNLLSCSQNAQNAFTQLPLLNDNVNTYNSRMQYRSIKRFLQPRSSLSKMTVRMLLNSGTMAPIREHVMRFEIRCRVDAPAPDEFTMRAYPSEGRAGGSAAPTGSYRAARAATGSRGSEGRKEFDAYAHSRAGEGGQYRELFPDAASPPTSAKKVAAIALLTVGAGAAASYLAYNMFYAS